MKTTKSPLRKNLLYGEIFYEKSLYLLVFLLLIAMLAGCEKGQEYFVGTIVEVTDSHYVVAPDDETLLEDDAAGVLVPKEVVAKQTVDFCQGERVQIVYNKISGGQIDIVYAIYRESELQQRK